MWLLWVVVKCSFQVVANSKAEINQKSGCLAGSLIRPLEPSTIPFVGGWRARINGSTCCQKSSVTPHESTRLGEPICSLRHCADCGSQIQSVNFRSGMFLTDLTQQQA